MGILVHHKETDRYIFYLKGADTVMLAKIPQAQRGFLMDECENLAREGLRTLVISQKFVIPEDYKKWAEIYENA
jgi:phospholipid-translocating ATPase